MKLMIWVAVAVGAALCGCSPEVVAGSSQDGGKKSASGFANVPADVHFVLPRDAIQAVWEPQFVAAADADMPADALVIGVAFDGEAHAYSINLLDTHEIVNDVVGGRKIAATW
ncbi:MAG: DUF3179 domain-containing protein [Armatimonadetes bacterium]|nr:DUF3179 domain-containing protein [Armatimonadota bacterium]